MNPDMDMFSSMVSSTCTLGNMVPYSKPFIYRNRAVQEKILKQYSQNFPTLTFRTKSLPTLGGRHLLVNSRN